MALELQVTEVLELFQLFQQLHQQVVAEVVVKMHLVLMEDPVVAEAEVVALEIVQVDQVILLL